MYSVWRGTDGNIGCIQRSSDGASIPLDENNKDYRKFLQWIEANPGHGLNLDKHDSQAVYKKPVDAELEAIKTKLAADDVLTGAEVRVALKNLLRA